MNIDQMEKTRVLVQDVIERLVDNFKGNKEMLGVIAYLHFELMQLLVKSTIIYSDEFPATKEEYLELLRDEIKMVDHVVDSYIEHKIESLYKELKSSFEELNGN